MAKARAESTALYDRAIADGSRAAKDARAAWRDFNRAKTRQGQTAALKRATSAEHRERLAANRASKYGNKIAAEEIKKDEEQGKKSPEWFVGLTYTGRQHRALLDFTIVRRDGAEMSEQEANAVVKLLHEGVKPDNIPAEYRIDSVAWGRTQRRAKGGDTSDLERFSSLVQGVMLKDFRVDVREPNE
jgi:hypothetical protein